MTSMNKCWESKLKVYLYTTHDKLIGLSFRILKDGWQSIIMLQIMKFNTIEVGVITSRGTNALASQHFFIEVLQSQ